MWHARAGVRGCPASAITRPARSGPDFSWVFDATFVHDAVTQALPYMYRGPTDNRDWYVHVFGVLYN